MLGYMTKNSDVYVFLEGREVFDLGEGVVRGVYFNTQDSTQIGLLEIAVNNDIGNCHAFVNAYKNEQGFIQWMQVEIKRKKYEQFLRDDGLKTREQFRHLNLLNSVNLEFGDMMNYDTLKDWEEKYCSKSSNRF